MSSVSVGNCVRSHRFRPGTERVTDNFLGVLQFGSYEFETRRPYSRISVAYLRLHKLDELNEIWDSIHPQQRQEPAIQFKSLFTFSIYAVIKKVHRFAG